MKTIQNLFKHLDKLDLKIMKIGLKICLLIAIFSVLLLLVYLIHIHTPFLYNLGISIFRLSTYFAIEFIICGTIADAIKKQL